MKKLTLILFSVLSIFAGRDMRAQGKFGADSAECIKYLSYYQEYYKQKNYDAALPNWRKAYQLCPPTASQNMLIHGTSLINRVITRNASNKEYVNALVDTLIALQDARIEYYPKYKETTLNNKGQYLIKYKDGDYATLYGELGKIVAELGDKTQSSILVYDLQSAIELYRKEAIPADEVINAYNTVIACVTPDGTESEEDRAQKAKVKADLEGIFADSKVASCDNIISIFAPRFEADPDNIELVSTIVKLMSNAEDCISNDLYLKAVTSMHKNEPSSNSAYFLYRLHSSRGNVQDAVKYLEEAINREGSDDAADAQYYYELANFGLKNGLKSKAFDAARKAAELGYGYEGKAYYLIGTIWGSTSCGGDEISRRAPYWVAVDYLQKAKAADPSLAEDANRLIGSYSAYYPQSAEAFMYNITNGQSYTVSCGGMTATTTVRTRN